MKKWILKAIVQKTISYLPFNNKINYIFQKYVTKGLYLSDEYFFDRLGHAKEHIQAYQKYSGQTVPSLCLEIGTGWYPIIPISFFLLGSDKTYSVDISFLTSRERVHTTLLRFKKLQSKNELKNFVHFKPERLQVLLDILTNFEELSLETILEKLHITYLIEDARQLSIADNSIDLINSNNTFEHIYPEILKQILAEFKRVAKKQDGVMSHFIDMSDHFAHSDKTINIYNFLQFSDDAWKWIDNSIQPQNRLRMDDYQEIYRELEIPITEESHRPGNLEALKTIKLDAHFANKTLKTNAISHCHFISDMKLAPLD